MCQMEVTLTKLLICNWVVLIMYSNTPLFPLALSTANKNVICFVHGSEQAIFPRPTRPIQSQCEASLPRTLLQQPFVN